MTFLETLKKIDKKCAVEQDAGTRGEATRWSNKDLDPVPLEKRVWGPVDVWSYWISDQFATPTWNLGSTIIALGLTAREGIPLTFLAFFVIGLALTATGRMGALSHCSFPVLVRASFGMWGGYFAILTRVILALLWLCIQTYQAGNITAVMLTAIWPSYGRIKNTLPEGLGITTQTLVGFVIYWIVQTPLACVPVHKLRYLFRVKAVICPIAFGGLFLWGCIVTKGKGDYIGGPTHTTIGKAWACISALNACTGLYSTLSVNMPDFCRFCRNGSVNWTQAIAVPVAGTTPVICAIFAAAAAKQKWGIDAWDPAVLIAKFDSRAAQFFAAFAMLLATVGSNISANSISFATDFTSILPRYFTIFRASIFAAILCFAVNPWKIVTSSGGFYNFISAYPVFIASICSIMATDFFLVRKGKIDINELYKPKGVYYYTYGINFRALASWIIALAPNLPAFANAIDPSNPNVQPYTYYFGWYFSTALSCVTYLLLNKVFPPTSSFVPEAVYELDFPEQGTGTHSEPSLPESEKDKSAAYVGAVEV
ncbi:NCS1 allantoate transporter [Pseudohyphozyma bogoriensis]|nr:NCS1 allantoate transporter [Pseudohyphozyma bogoriensis]